MSRSTGRRCYAKSDNTLPSLVMLAGPNGAGKTTFYEAYLADKNLPFINADQLAARFNLEPYPAARMAGEMRSALIDERISFVTETVFSDPVGSKLGLLKRAVDSGYEVTLIFIGLSCVELSRLRVHSRVSAGGHFVPAEKLPGRYERSLLNLKAAISCVPRVLIYDNSSISDCFRLIADCRAGQVAPVLDRTQWPDWVRRAVNT